MGVHIYGVFNTFIFVVLCVMFVQTFAEKRELPRKWPRYLIIVCMVAADYAASVTLDRYIVAKEIVIIGLGTLFMWLLFKQKCLNTAILVLLYQGICVVMDYISILLMSKCFPAITIERLAEPLITTILGILGQMLVICFIMLLRRFFVKKSAEMMTIAEWLRFAVFPVFTIAVLVTLLIWFEIPESSNQKNILICIAFGLLVMNIIVFGLINDILRREVQITEDRLLLERVKNETGMYRAISENYDKQLKREHEYKNQLAVIAALACENRVEEIKGYLKEYNDGIMEHTDLIDTNHVIVNAIINSKYQEAREKGIVFVVKVNDLSNLQISDEDMVLILSNLLNNAMEACEKCEDAVVRLKLVKEKGQVVISVGNTYSRELSIQDNRILTSKTDHADMHGIGIENIKETVEKYGGSCVIKHDGKNFRFAILIPE